MGRKGQKKERQIENNNKKNFRNKKTITKERNEK